MRAELSVQLYTVRDLLAADPDDTLARIAGLGFGRVEPYGLPQSADMLRTRLPAHGLTAPTAHGAVLGPDGDAALAVAAELGVTTLVQPKTDPARWRDESGVVAIADELNRAAERAAAYGVRVGYHNHQSELEARIGGRHALEVLAGHLSPEVVLEVDTYWAHAGGADVPALLRRLGGRVAALHVKDGDGSLDPKAQTAVGAGRLPVAEFLAAAPDALRVIELDDTAGDLMAAVAASRAFLLGDDR